MFDLKEEDLGKLPSDRKVRKFMSEVKRVNEDAAFMHYMTKEEDDGPNLKKLTRLIWLK